MSDHAGARVEPEQDPAVDLGTRVVQQEAVHVGGLKVVRGALDRAFSDRPEAPPMVYSFSTASQPSSSQRALALPEANGQKPLSLKLPSAARVALLRGPITAATATLPPLPYTSCCACAPKCPSSQWWAW